MIDPAESGSSLLKDDLVPDAALTDAGQDSLDRAPVARIASDLARSVDTKSNIALFGPWGSGKSSIYAMMKDNIAASDPTIAVVDYDAWKFGGNSLHRNFLMHLATRLDVPSDKYLSDLHSGTETTRLRLGRFLWRNKASLLMAFLVAAIAGAGWLLLSAWAASQVGSPSFKEELVKGTPGAAIVFAAVVGGLLLSNQALASAVEKRTRSPLQDADQFSAAFDNLMRYVMRRRWFHREQQISKLVVFIDELDRCAPEDVVTTLIDLKTFLHHDKCVFIVAADRDVLERALEDAPQAKPVREDEPYYSTAGAFLDKIFQHQMSLPPMRPEALTDFAMTLAAKQAGLWATLRTDRRRYEDVVYALVPAHVQSPRRVKVLMNNFATTARVIESRNIDWLQRAVEIAVLTVLETEFPSVVKDLMNQPRLLQALVNDVDSVSDDLRRFVDIYTPTHDSEAKNRDPTQGPAGSLLAEESVKATQLSRAQSKLNQQLDAYLSKVHAAGIPFPSLELVYLQNAGHAQGLINPDLATLLDFAADTDPAQLVDAFFDAASVDRRAAVLFLATKANTTFGPGRANIVESCCRLAEQLTTEDLRSVAAIAASTVLGEAPKGRWRPEATPGAILLGLFDPTITNPIAQLGEHADAVTLANSGLLSRISPMLPGLDDDRAEEIHRLLGAAYASESSAMHEALRDLPEDAANRLWRSQGRTVTTVIAELPAPVPAAASASRARATTVEEEVEPKVPETALARYEALLDSVGNRHQAATDVSIGALEVALTADRTGLYEAARAHVKDYKDTIIADPTRLNDYITRVISATSEDVLFDGEHTDIEFWIGLLDTNLAIGGHAEAAAETIIDAVRDIPVSQTPLLPGLVRPFVPSLNVTTADRMVAYIDAVLKRSPFAPTNADVGTEPAEKRREACYALLDEIEPVLAAGSADRIRRLDLQRAVKDETFDADTVDGMLRYVPELTGDGAAQLDVWLGNTKAPQATLLLRTRLRIRARQHAGKTALSSKTFRSALTDDATSATVMREWLATSPPVSDLLPVLSKCAPGTQSIENFVRYKNITDRSRLWISLHKHNYNARYLRSAGRLGVNATVVEALSDNILAADLTRQKELVDMLLTATLGADTGAKAASTELAIALLQSGVAGSGQHAARIILNTRGAARGQTQSLRNAFDHFTAKHPKTINKGDLRQLDEMGLLTKQKKSPISMVLDWVFD